MKGLCLQLKRSWAEYAVQKINFLTSTVSNGLPLSEKFHLVLTWFRRVVDELLPVYFSIP